MSDEERREAPGQQPLDRQVDPGDPANPTEGQVAPRRRKLSVLATIKAMLWSFFGVRKHSDYEQDSAELNPVVVIVAGLLGGLIFVAVLLTIARMVVRSATS